MNRLIRYSILFSFFLFFFSISISNAKRTVPTQPKNIEDQNVIYSAPLERMGYIEARDAITGRLIWENQLYKINYDRLLEKDIQDDYIIKLEKDGDLITAVDEKGNVYRINIKDMQQRKGYKVNSVWNHFIDWLKSALISFLNK